MVLRKRSVPGRPTNLENNRASSCGACSNNRWSCFGHFSLVCHFSLLPSSIWEMARHRLK